MYTLEKYADSLFENVPDSKEARELHDEILSDMKSRYADCIESGMTPERAYAAVIGTMGDMSGLIGQLCGDNYTAYPGKADEGKYDYLFTKENYKTIKKTINAVLWIFVTIVFLLLIGFTDFSLPWLVFLAGAAVSEMINLAFAIARNEKKGRYSADKSKNPEKDQKAHFGSYVAWDYNSILCAY